MTGARPSPPEDPPPGGTPRRNFYGRRHGKALRDSQRRLLEEDLPRLSAGPVGPQDNPRRRPLDLAALFDGRPVWLEIGFGGGEHLVHQAKANPRVGLLGCEPFVNGVAMCLAKRRAEGVDNIRIHPGDVRDLLDVLPPASIARAFLLYPDPWPKAKHHRRRAVTPEYLAPLARAMAPGAALRIATDIPDYVRQALEEVPRHGFRWTAARPADWREPWADWAPTRYERKALREGRRPHYLTFERRTPSS
jgi:tRNA (guanine-N7-)-methyltransferase